MNNEVIAHETKQANRMTKASVFEDLFSDRENLFAMYQVLHPEDTTATVNDVRHVTLKNILTRGHYNDLGFVVGKRLVILVEAQSTWSVNIIPRSIMYLAETWSRYFVIECYDIYSSTPVDIPEPELYVIYTGDKKIDKVIDIMTLLYNQEQATHTMLEKERRDGMATGFLNGISQMLLSYMKKTHCSAEDAMDEFDIDASQRDTLRPLLA